jgi:hypothetical protein
MNEDIRASSRFILINFDKMIQDGNDNLAVCLSLTARRKRVDIWDKYSWGVGGRLGFPIDTWHVI